MICRPAPHADRAAFSSYLGDEMVALRELHQAGVLIQAYTTGTAGAVLMLDVEDALAAARVTDDLPLKRAGLIQTEIIPIEAINLDS